MKTANKVSRIFLSLVLACFLSLTYTGCSNTPTAPDSGELVNLEDMNLIAFGDGAHSLSKRIAASTLVTPDSGGTLILMNGKDWEVEDFEELTDTYVYDADFEDINTMELSEKSRLFIKLEVPPQAVDTDTTIHVAMDEKKIDMEFGPHGLNFNQPAALTIIATKLKLENVNTETLNIYYANPDTGQWEKVEGAIINVDKKHGFLIVRDAQIPHFSRYAVAWAR